VKDGICQSSSHRLTCVTHGGRNRTRRVAFLGYTRFAGTSKLLYPFHDDTK
jgi:hypothetical protein